MKHTSDRRDSGHNGVINFMKRHKTTNSQNETQIPWSLLLVRLGAQKDFVVWEEQ